MFAFIFFSELILVEKSYRWKLYPFIAILLIAALGEKDRNQFLKSIFPLALFSKIRLVENLLMAAPFSFFLLFKSYYILAVLVLVTGCILSKFNKLAFTRFKVPSPFSKNPYEFTVGFRRSYLLIATIYILAFISIYYHYFYFGLLSLLSVFLFCLSFYSELDPIFFVWIYAQSSKAFLTNKIKIALVYSFSLSIVIFLPMLIIYSSRIGLILLTILTGLLYIVLGIVAVYSNFPVKKTMSQNIQLYLGITIPPLLLLVIPNLYYQAICRLKEYLKC